MPRLCSICTHWDLEAINVDIVEGHDSLRGISSKHAVSESALARHRDHIPETLTSSAQAADVLSASNVVARVIKLADTAQRVLTKAESGGDHKLVLAAIREARPLAELLARLAGALAPTSNSVNVQINAVGAVQVAQPQTRAELERDIRQAQELLARMVADEERANALIIDVANDTGGDRGTV